ncbi:MAG: hypothetical protein HKN76_13720 [Saprospiraceae bacterium]|nr:hypothetical protein [Saprospiraceae bacterium]
MMQLTNKEFELIQDVDFILTKVSVLNKMRLLLERVRLEMISVVIDSDFNFPVGVNLSSGKISKGENYRSLPYQVLDYPAYFDRENIFAIRTMFLWGHFFSCTLHLQGMHLDRYRENIWENRNKLIEQDLYISVGETPWQYHYEQDNYVYYTKEQEDHLKHPVFLKLSKKVALGDLERLPAESGKFIKLMLSIL